MELPKRFSFELRSPDKLWVSGDVTAVRLSTEMGEMEIRPAHISVVGNIDFTTLRVETGDHVEEYFVRYGTLIIDYGGDTVHVLAEDVQTHASMDIKSLSEYLHYLTERLSQKDGLTQYQLRYFGEQKDILEKSMAVLQKVGK